MIPAHVSQRPAAHLVIAGEQYQFLMVEEPVTAPARRPLKGATAYTDMPADFLDNLGMTNVELGKLYGVHKNTIARMRKRAGLPPSKPRPPGVKHRQRPADFAEVAATMSLNGLVRHYRTGCPAVNRWLAEVGISKAKPQVVMPDDFATIAPTMTMADACFRFGIGMDTLRKWEKRAGAKCIRGKVGAPYTGGRKPRPPKPPKPPKVKKEKPVAFVRAAPAPKKPHKIQTTAIRVTGPQRDMSRAGQAADFLRRIAPVYRCNDVGAQAIGGKFWRYGNSLPLTDAELIERAVRKGFDPDAWMRIAA